MPLLEFWMSATTDTSSPASRCQLLQKGKGRKAGVGPPHVLYLDSWCLPSAEKEKLGAPPLLQANLAAGLPSDKSCARTPPEPERAFFLSHTVGCNVKVIPWAQSAYFKHPISPLLCQGGLYIFHEVSKYAFREKNISMATDPSHGVEWLMQLS